MSRNVVLVSIDSLRADHCGYIEQDCNLTPTLDTLAADGIGFKNAVVPGPRTPSSVPPTFTGRIDRTADFSLQDWQARYQHVSNQMTHHRTLPRRLQNRGYSTIGITTNPWTHKADFDTGFDQYIEIDGEILSQASGPLFSAVERGLDLFGLEQRYNWKNVREWLVRWEHYYDIIVEALRSADQPYFLWVFILDTHQPYIASADRKRETSILSTYYSNLRERQLDNKDIGGRVKEGLKRSYRDTVRSVDVFLRKLRNECQDDPLFIVHSDHGEAFGEHGSFGHDPMLYEENIRVPLVVSGTAQSTQVEELFSLTRLPDLIEALVDNRTFDPSQFTDQQVVASTEDGARETLRGDRWKYISNAEQDELYDLVRDPGEERNVIEEFPSKAQALCERLVSLSNHQREVASLAHATSAVDLPGPSAEAPE